MHLFVVAAIVDDDDSPDGDGDDETLLQRCKRLRRDDLIMKRNLEEVWHMCYIASRSACVGVNWL